MWNMSKDNLILFIIIESWYYRFLIYLYCYLIYCEDNSKTDSNIKNS